MHKHVAALIVVLFSANIALADRVVKRPDSATVYLQRDNVLYPIPNARSFECMGFDWKRIDVLDNKEWSRLKVGERLPSLEDNTLIRGSSPAIYQMTGCQRRHIPDAATFDHMRLNGNAVQAAPDWMLKLVKEGPAYPSSDAAGTVAGKGSDPKEKARKVECVFSRPHIVLDNRVDYPVSFQLLGSFRMEGKPEGNCGETRWEEGIATLIVRPKGECKVILSKAAGGVINRVQVVVGKTIASDGKWDVFGCCRNTSARQDAAVSSGQSAVGLNPGIQSAGSPEGGQGGWQAALNDAIRSDKYNGTAWRAYRAVYDNKGLNVWTRDKDSNIPFSARTGWESLEYTPGSCSGDK